MDWATAVATNQINLFYFYQPATDSLSTLPTNVKFETGGKLTESRFTTFIGPVSCLAGNASVTLGCSLWRRPNGVHAVITIIRNII
jgi:hypothetical protein